MCPVGRKEHQRHLDADLGVVVRLAIRPESHRQVVRHQWRLAVAEADIDAALKENARIACSSNVDTRSDRNSGKIMNLPNVMIRSGETILEKALTVKLCSRPSSIGHSAAQRTRTVPTGQPPDVHDPDVRELVERIQERSPSSWSAISTKKLRSAQYTS